MGFFDFLFGPKGPSQSTGRDGSSEENAIIIDAPSSLVGIPQEYAYVERVCGKRNVDFTLETQMQVTSNEREYDILEIKLRDGSTRVFWFDITSFFGKF